MKTDIKLLLKLWLFDVAKCYGGHFEKKALEDRGLELARLPELFHGSKSGKGVQHAWVLQGYQYILLGQALVFCITIASFAPR